MRERNDEVDGHFLINEDLAFHGLVDGIVTVLSGATLRLHGTVTGHLFVELDASAIVMETVNGVVVNRGGIVEIFRTVGDGADEDARAVTTIHEGAVVKGRA